MLGRTNLVVPKLLTNTKLRIHRHQGSSVCGVQHRHAHARTRVHTHPQRSRTLTNAYRHSTPCKKLTEREKTGSFPHLQGENREKKGVFTPKQRQGAPKRTICQDKCPEGETGIPVCLWSGQGDWPRAHLRRGKERIEKWQGAGRGQPARHHWHPKGVSFQCVTWRLRKGAGLELCCWYRKIWLQKEKTPDLFPAHTLHGARGETDRAGTRRRECRLAKIRPQQISHSGIRAGGTLPEKSHPKFLFGCLSVDLGGSPLWIKRALMVPGKKYLSFSLSSDLSHPSRSQKTEEKKVP